MLDVTFIVGDKKYTAIKDWKCYPKRFFVGEAIPKFAIIDVPYGNGALDVTSALGDVTYHERNIEIPMIIIADDPMEIYSEISNTIHGQTAKVIFNQDSDYYYQGRFECETLQTSGLKWQFTISGTVFPYKYYIHETKYTKKATTGGTSVICRNDRMNVIPTFITTASGQVTITQGTNTYSFSSAGSHKFGGLVFTKGQNEITLTGSNINVEITYRQGRL